MPWWGWLLLGVGLTSAAVVTYLLLRWVAGRNATDIMIEHEKRVKLFKEAADRAAKAEVEAKNRYIELVLKIQQKAKEREIAVKKDAEDEIEVLSGDPDKLVDLLDTILDDGGDKQGEGGSPQDPEGSV